MNGKLEHARRYTQESILKTMEDGGWTVNVAPPNAGKTFGFLKNLSKEEFEGALFQPNHDLRDETVGKAESLDLSARDLPSFPELCPLMHEGSPDYSNKAEDWHSRGMYPRQIICRLGSPDDDPYLEALDEKWDEDVLVGDPNHSFLTRPITDRHVAFDDANIGQRFLSEHDVASKQVKKEIKEYLKTYKQKLAHVIEATAVTEHKPELLNEVIPCSVSELLTASPDMKSVIYSFVCDNPSADIIDSTESVRASTSDVIRVLTSGSDRIQWEETDPFIDGGVINIGVFYKPLDVVLLFCLPAALQEAKSVQVLSATPELPILRQFFEQFNRPFDEHSVLQPLPDDLLEHYFDEILNMKIVRTTDRLRPISGNNWTGCKSRLRNLIVSFRMIYDEDPLVITSKKLIDELEEDTRRRDVFDGFFDPIYDLLDDGNFIHFAKAVGTNKFEDISKCIVFGSPHYGDDYVRKMSALAGDMNAEPIRHGSKPTTWSTSTSTEIYDRMTAGAILQFILRAGRSTDERTHVWVESCAIPDYVPHTYWPMMMVSDSQQDVFEFVHGSDSPVAVAEISEAVDLSRRRVYELLEDLADPHPHSNESPILEVVDQGKWNANVFKSKSWVRESLEQIGYKLYIQLVQSFGHHAPDLSTAPGEYVKQIGERVSERSDVTDFVKYGTDDDGIADYSTVEKQQTLIQSTIASPASTGESRSLVERAVETAEQLFWDVERRPAAIPGVTD